MKKFLVLLTLLGNILLSENKTMACGGSDDDWWGNDPYIFLSSFVADTTYIRYFDAAPHCDECSDLLHNAIVNEWAAQFPKAEWTDIETALFGLSKQDLQSLSQGTNPVSGNGFLAFLIQNQQTEVIAYLNFIADENALTVKEYNYWEEEIAKNKTTASALLAIAKEKATTLSHNPFLQQKYVYQVVRLLFYNEQYPEVVSYFEDNIKASTPPSLTYYRSLGYKAGAIRKNGDLVQAKYLFATIFDKSPALRHMAYKNFKYIYLEENDWPQCLAYAKNNSERSSLWIVKNVYEDVVDVRALQELYTNDPASGRLEIALLKQLNNFHNSNYIAGLKATAELDSTLLIKNPYIYNESGIDKSTIKEDGWFTRLWRSVSNFFRKLFGKAPLRENHEGVDKEPEVTYRQHAFKEEWLGEIISLLEKINNEKKTKNPELYKLALGYTYIADGEFDKGEKELKTIAGSTNSDMKELAEYLTQWSTLLKAEKISDELEENLITYLQANPKLDSQRKNELVKELGRRYLIEKQYDKAYLIFNGFGHRQIDNYYTLSILDGLLEKVEKGQNSKFNVHFGTIRKEDILRNYAYKLALMGRFEEASSKQNSNLAFEEDDAIVTYKDLSALLKKRNEESYAKLANYLSTSSSWPYNQTPSYNYYPYFYYERTCEYPFNVSGMAETIVNRANLYIKQKYSTELAESYYRKAFELSKNDERKAEILFMAQTVAIKDKYAFKDGKTVDKGYYYAEMEKFKNTKFYQEAYNSCSFLQYGKIFYY